ncbi:unnamed protein product [Ranitomeya imitator]|uniref:ribonuclease H n=1 Tax=Ranitomeya imitator TaxID=111125 RepID=A0ABN9M8R2_9NEOB|nr:unnamed protein product [Ranitomeya imitator]
MFTLVTGIVGRWRAVCVTALQRPNSDAAAIRIVVGIAAASLSVTIGRRLRERKSVHHLAVLPELKPEPMQCDRTLTRVERQEHRRLNGLCFYCGDSTHAISDCPKRTTRFARSATIGTVQSKFLLSVTLICSLSSYSVMAFVDSGAALNLMDLEYAKRCGFLLEPLQCPIPLRGIDATPLAKNKPQYWTQLTMCMAPAHQEVIRFLVLHKLHDVVVLGLPWLQAHNPVLDWKSMSVSSWGCQGVHGDVPFLSISSSTPSEVPEFLSDYRDVFDEPKSDALPPHRDCDCAINLIPGSKFPKGRLFNLSVPEHAAMRSYVKESLEKGHIRPSSSPLGAGFFFVAKKDGSLRPCIDYRLLNKITVKFQYPLPLLSDLFARIKGASWFTKIDLHSAYNLVRIRRGDEWKTAFNTPEGHFEYLVMPFGLANAPSVFQSFMHDIFREYLDKFLIVYLDDILIFSDDWESHVKQVEVDASEIGAGAVLSQRGQVESSDCPGVDTVVDRLRQIWTHVVDNLTLSQEKAQRFANRRRRVGPRLRVGDLREAYAPQVFFEASRPPWFTPRSQQDCSEYLRFLLDRLHEEEKTLKALSSRSPDTMITDGNVQPCSPSAADVIPNLQNTSWRSDDKTLIESMFGGKLQTNICCLNCRSTSQKIEAFSDLSLAFCPSAADKPAQNMICLPVKKDDDCIEIDVVPETELKTETLPSSECDNDSTKPKSAGSDVQANSSCAINTPTCESIVECAIDSCRNSGRDKPLSVTDLLNYFLAPEILDGENRYHCEKCSSLQNAEKTMQILEEPEYLILTLLRFSYDPKCHVRRKILDNVSIPLVLELPVERTTSVASPGDWNRDVDIPDVGENLAKKLKPSGTEDMSCTQLIPYVLSSIVVHSGTSSESGHYYSYARNISNSTRCIQPEKSISHQSQIVGKETCNVVVGNDKPCNDLSKEWFLFNDSRVTFTSFESVLNITSRFPKDTAYVLIYKKHSSGDLENVQSSSAHGLWVNGEPPLQKELMDAITKDNKLYLQEQELNARTRALQAASASCSFRPNGFDDNDPPGSCGPTGGGGEGGFSTIGRLVF